MQLVILVISMIISLLIMAVGAIYALKAESAINLARNAGYPLRNTPIIGGVWRIGTESRLVLLWIRLVGVVITIIGWLAAYTVMVYILRG